MRKSVYEIITERILEKLEAGTVPWHKPWKAGGSPCNLVSGREYRGVNVFLLASEGFTSPFWLTFKQAKALGGNVRKGEGSTPVVFWKWTTRETENPETRETDTQKIPLVRYYSVFSVEQCEGLTHKRLTELEQEEPEPFCPIESAERIAASYPSPPSISEDGGGSAFYLPSTDSIHLPKRETFDSKAAYYATLFHEAAHSTGHESRLARSGITNPVWYASHEYSQEELVAEMGSAFLLAEAGIDAEDLTHNSAAYLASWLKALRNDKRLVVFAGAQAQKAVDHILDRSSECEAAE